MGSLGAPRPRGFAIRGLITAIRFLTIVPVPGPAVEGPENLGRAAGWFPLIGLALGVVLTLVDRLLSLIFPPTVSALLVVLSWKLLTGGIHLDGLADSLDGLTGKNSAERLAIMRDSRIGVFGALGLILLLLLALVALAGLPSSLRAQALLLAPAVGRVMPLLLARTCEPATPGRGSGAAFMERVTSRALVVGGVLVAVASGVIRWPWGLVAAGSGLSVSWALARFFSVKLGGLSGDGLGAGVEVAELGVLLAFASLHHLGLS
ncbi:MAG: adenosylcobinamide-GDP ribazoletransferase [Candidatus Rokubacteria bacterium]|nr:adenosylcobinamide-GDP ribazoletransferase [Candidatus Rokubacteria bacterium]